MSRYPLQTVTPPILIDAALLKGKADGACAVFPNKGGERLLDVRVVSNQKAVNWVNNNQSPFARALSGLSSLRSAYETKDETALSKAIEKSRPLLPKLPGTITEDWTGNKIWAAARWHFSEAMSHAIRNVRWVVWWPFSGEHDPLPGVYCPDMQAAVAMAIFLQGIRVCPKCGTPFVPKQDNIKYCKPSHGGSYRTARSRAKK